MCGIFGIVDPQLDVRPSVDALEESARLLAHRGPDSVQVFCEPGIGLAHTRLSLLDLSDRSRQPFWDSERRFGLVFNGEIYNFKELRKELEESGVTINTTGDTEVVLQCLIHFGWQAALPRFEGMFALGLYDRSRRRLLLARDRFGIKPLYFSQDGERFLFSSTVKAMTPWLSLRPNVLAVTAYLMGSDGPTKGGSFYEGVGILTPGSVVELEVGRSPTFSSFLQLENLLDSECVEELAGLGAEAIVDRVDEALQRSVRHMLFADAQVGALCSGGVDSSVIMAMAARQHSNLAIFHANVLGPCSEYDAALALSKHLGLDLKVAEVRDRDFIDLIPEITQHYEHPFSYHPNSAPFLMVSRLVRTSGVKAVLSGEGSDECFLGYQYLAQEPVEDLYARFLERMRALVGRIPKLGRRLWPEPDSSPTLVRGMLDHFEREFERQDARRAYEDRTGHPESRSVRTLDLLGFHLRTLLHRNDCLGMAASIEARFPFLDERLVKTAVNLPYSAKIRFSPFSWERAHPLFRDKWVLRRVADRYLPRELSRREKQGFPVTAFDRLEVPSRLFRGSFVADMFDLTERQLEYLFESGNRELRLKLLLTDVWGRVFIQGHDPEDERVRLQESLSIADV